jgi:hypothetical protein
MFTAVGQLAYYGPGLLQATRFRNDLVLLDGRAELFLYSIRDYIRGPESLEYIRASRLGSMVHPLSLPFILYVQLKPGVVLARRSGLAMLLPQVMVFPSPLGTMNLSVAFSFSRPSGHAGVIEKFCVLHEFGHATKYNMRIDALPLLLVASLVAMVCLSATTWHLVPGSLFGFLYVACYVYFLCRQHRAALASEIAADAFAIEVLKREGDLSSLSNAEMILAVVKAACANADENEQRERVGSAEELLRHDLANIFPLSIPTQASVAILGLIVLVFAWTVPTGGEIPFSLRLALFWVPLTLSQSLALLGVIMSWMVRREIRRAIQHDNASMQRFAAWESTYRRYTGPLAESRYFGEMTAKSHGVWAGRNNARFWAVNVWVLLAAILSCGFRLGFGYWPWHSWQ